MRIPGIPYHQGVNNYADNDGLHYGFAIHNTSNTATDTNEANYADHRTDGVSSHFYCDRDSVTQSLDTDRKAGHAGSSTGNSNSIAFELTGTNDRSRQWWLDNIAWSQLGYVIAYIVRHDPDYAGFQVRRASVAEMRSNPRVKAFYGHDDMRLAWGGTTHTDPGGNFPWDRLLSAVNAALNPSAGGPTVPTYSAPNPNAGENVEEMLRALLTGGQTYANAPALTGKVKGMGGEPYATPAALYPKLEAILTAAQGGGFTDAQAEDIAQRLFNKTSTSLGDVIISALLDPRVQAARVQAANTAEDS